MSKTKDDKKKREAADTQKSGSHKKDKPVSSVVELVQNETDAFEPVQPKETGSENPPTAPDAEDQNGDSSEADETVSDVRSDDGSQTSESEEEGDSLDSGGSGKVDPFGRPLGENLPMTLADAEDPNAGSDEPVETAPDNGSADVEGDVSQAKETESGQPNVATDSPKDEELSKEKIDELASKIKANHEKADNSALKTGHLLLTEVFGGKLNEALSRNPKKKKSFADICKHPDVNVDTTTLSRWVQAANLVQTFKSEGKNFRSLTCSHYIALLSLEKDENRLRLAEEADEKKLSVRKLAQEVKKLEHPFPKSLLESISSKLENPKELAKEEKSLLDKKKWAELSSEDRETLTTRVKNAKVGAQTYINQLARFQRLLEEIAAEAK